MSRKEDWRLQKRLFIITTNSLLQLKYHVAFQYKGINFLGNILLCNSIFLCRKVPAFSKSTVKNAFFDAVSILVASVSVFIYLSFEKKVPLQSLQRHFKNRGGKFIVCLLVVLPPACGVRSRNISTEGKNVPNLFLLCFRPVSSAVSLR